MNDEEYLPPVSVRRSMLQQNIASAKQQVYALLIERDTKKKQNPGEHELQKEQHKRALANLEVQIKNAKVNVDELNAMFAALPEEGPAEETPQ